MPLLVESSSAIVCGSGGAAMGSDSNGVAILVAGGEQELGHRFVIVEGDLSFKDAAANGDPAAGPQAALGVDFDFVNGRAIGENAGDGGLNGAAGSFEGEGDLDGVSGRGCA